MPEQVYCTASIGGLIKDLWQGECGSTIFKPIGRIDFQINMEQVSTAFPLVMNAINYSRLELRLQGM